MEGLLLKKLPHTYPGALLWQCTRRKGELFKGLSGIVGECGNALGKHSESSSVAKWGHKLASPFLLCGWFVRNGHELGFYKPQSNQIDNEF